MPKEFPGEKLRVEQHIKRGRQVISKSPVVTAVSASRQHGFSKSPQGTIRLLAGLGVEGDAHCGEHVQHLYDRAKNPAQPNLRQVHLVEQELLEHLATLGFDFSAGQLAENITTSHIELHGLRTGTILRLGANARIRITGLREPCVKIARLRSGLREAVTRKRDGETFMRGVVMAVVVSSGEVGPGDLIQIQSPPADERNELRLV